jgi:flagellar hook-associated protein 1 FlgK
MTVGSTLNEFFSAVNQLGVDPSNLDLRLNVLQKGEDLVSTIRTTFQELANSQNELDQRVGMEVGSINSITKEVAYLNSVIAQRESVGVSATDERDQRDTVLAKLAEKISFNIVETPNGMVNCVLENGFPLVNQETSRDLSVTATPTFGGATMPRSLSDSVLSYVVYNFGSENAPSHLDLTQMIKNGGGSLGGVLQMRGYADPSNTSPYEADGDIVALATRIEALTRTLITEVNQVYRGGDEDPVVPGTQPRAGDLNGNAPDVFGLFDFDFSGVKDVDGDGDATLADLAGTGLHTFSNLLKLGISTPDQFAAARDLDPTPGSLVFGSGDGSNAQALAGLRTETFGYSLGALSFSGTFDELYNSAVSTAGNMKSAAQLEADVANASYMTASSKRDEFSSVNLDEEFANVIKYQKAFQASARMIKTASDILDVIVSLI